MDTLAERVVVAGCDGSWESLAAVELAAREAEYRGTPLAILSVPGPRDLYAGSLADVPRLERDAMDRGAAVAARALERVRRGHPTLRARVVVAFRNAPEVEELAAHSDLLVLGGHGHGGQSTFSIGSTSAALVHAFPGPVLVAGPGRTTGAGVPPHPKVLAGLAGSVEDPFVAAAAVYAARARAWPLVVVRVLPGQRGVGEPRLRDALTRTWDTMRAAAPDGVHLRVETAQGEPLNALVAQCDAPDLLVVGNRGSARLTGLVPGSLCVRLVEHAPCDLLLVPGPAASAAGPAPAFVREESAGTAVSVS